MAEYSDAFRAKMVQRMSGPRRVSAMALSRELNMPQSTLSSWLRRAQDATMTPMVEAKKETRPAKGGERSAVDKARLVFEADGCSEEQLGELLRREGVYEAELEQWRAALEGSAATPSKASEKKRIKELERELRRKDRALAEMTALAVLKKKAQAIWGDGDDDTDEKNE